MNSQNTLIEGNRLKLVINKNGDKELVISYDDGKDILSDLLKYEKLDSINKLQLKKIEFKDSLIVKKNDFINQLESKNLINESIISNKDSIVLNLNKQKTIFTGKIKNLDAQLRIQKKLKIFGFSLAVAIPIATIILLK